MGPRSKSQERRIKIQSQPRDYLVLCVLRVKAVSSKDAQRTAADATSALRREGAVSQVLMNRTITTTHDPVLETQSHALSRRYNAFPMDIVDTKNLEDYPE